MTLLSINKKMVDNTKISKKGINNTKFVELYRTSRPVQKFGRFFFSLFYFIFFIYLFGLGAQLFAPICVKGPYVMAGKMFEKISPDSVRSGRTCPANLGVRSCPVRKLICPVQSSPTNMIQNWPSLWYFT